MNIRGKSWLFRCLSLVTGLLAVEVSGQTNLDIDGLGWLDDHAMEQRLSFLHGYEADEKVALDAILLEDSAYLILQEVKDTGYLFPALEAHLVSGGRELSARWESHYEVQLPVEFIADRVEFDVIPGLRYYYDTVEVEGVTAIEPKRVQRYFIPGGFIFRQQSSVFTYSSLDRRAGRVVQTLNDLGYRSAKEVGREVQLNDETGQVHVKLAFEQGPLYRVGAVEVERHTADSNSSVIEPDASEVGALFTADWERNYRIKLRNAAYERGYPDARVKLHSELMGSGDGAEVSVRVRLTVTEGEQVRLESVRFEGDPDTNRSVLARKVDLEPSEWLNPLEVNAGQRALMSLGIFREVNLSYEPDDGSERTVVYDLKPGERKALELLGGWGSYEQARIGFNWRHLNPWGRAHRYEVEAKQSLKASNLEATYSIPYIFDSPLTAYTRGQYTYREEISYDRESKGGAVGTAWWLGKTGVRMSVEYGYVQEDADRSSDAQFESQDQATIASITFRATLDERDDLLAPTSGYSLFSAYEWASESLGGSVNFHRVELGGSYHFPLLESVLVHAGLRGGVILSEGAASDNIPFNSRFFNGGENSVRGYREGQASPLDADGEEFGAESYVLFNFELEQRLSRSISLVEFVDGVYFSEEGAFDQGDAFLYSIGLGIRYQTVVGPIRLEYGYNPDPRPEDPEGRLHLSVGFPF